MQRQSLLQFTKTSSYFYCLLHRSSLAHSLIGTLTRHSTFFCSTLWDISWYSESTYSRLLGSLFAQSSKTFKAYRSWFTEGACTLAILGMSSLSMSSYMSLDIFVACIVSHQEIPKLLQVNKDHDGPRVEALLTHDSSVAASNSVYQKRR